MKSESRLDIALVMCSLLFSASGVTCSSAPVTNAETAVGVVNVETLPAEVQRPLCKLSFESHGGKIAPGMEHDVVLLGAPVTIEFTSNGVIAQAKVHRPLEFSGPVSIESLDLRTVRTLEIEELARISKGAVLREVEKTRDGLVGKARIGPAIAEGGFPILLSPVPLECEDIAGDRSPEDEEDRLDEWLTRNPTGRLAVVRTKRIELRSQPDGTKNLTIELAAQGRDDPEAIPLFASEEREGMTRVGVIWSGGSALSGWVQSSLLSEPNADEREYIERAFARIGLLTTHGYGSGRGTGKVAYSGPASLQPGAPVYSQPGAETAWAKVVDSGPYEVLWEADSPWVTIVEAPLLGRFRKQAYIEKRKVTFLEEPEP